MFNFLSEFVVIGLGTLDRDNGFSYSLLLLALLKILSSAFIRLNYLPLEEGLHL